MKSALIEDEEHLNAANPVLRERAQAVWDYHNELKSLDGEFAYEVAAPLWEGGPEPDGRGWFEPPTSRV